MKKLIYRAMLDKIREYFLSSLRIIGLSLLIDLAFLIILMPFGVFFSAATYWVKILLSLFISLVLIFLVVRTKLGQETKAAIMVIPLQLSFIFVSFLFEFFLLRANINNKAIFDLLYWFASLIIPIGVILFLLWRRKTWHYFLSAFIALASLVCVFFSEIK